MCSLVIAIGIGGTATADPDPQPAPTPVQPTISPLLFVGVPPPPPPPSLRLEAARVIGERFAADWRYPEPSDLLGHEGNGWFFGAYHYQPRTARSAALHGGSVAATLVGEILMAADSPFAAVGALLTGATLDAAAADLDRNAEAQRR
jgi:hypothetical protein